MTTPEPVTGATQDHRIDALTALLAEQSPADRGNPAAFAGYRMLARRLISAADAADAAAGIRRVTAQDLESHWRAAQREALEITAAWYDQQADNAETEERSNVGHQDRRSTTVEAHRAVAGTLRSRARRAGGAS